MKKFLLLGLTGLLIPHAAFAQMYGTANNGMYGHPQAQPYLPAQPIYVAPIAQAPQPPQYNQNSTNAYRQNYINSLPTQHVCTRTGNNSMICN